MCVCVARHCRATSWNALTFYCSPGQIAAPRCFYAPGGPLCILRTGSPGGRSSGIARLEEPWRISSRMREKAAVTPRCILTFFPRPSQMSLNRRSMLSYALEMESLGRTTRGESVALARTENAHENARERERRIAREKRKSDILYCSHLRIDPLQFHGSSLSGEFPTIWLYRKIIFKLNTLWTKCSLQFATKSFILKKFRAQSLALPELL